MNDLINDVVHALDFGFSPDSIIGTLRRQGLSAYEAWLAITTAQLVVSSRERSSRGESPIRLVASA